MAPRRGAPVVEEEVQPGQLVFNQPLSWKAGKPIPTAELLKRLDALSIELREMDQDEADASSLHGVAKELAGHNLISHKDKGVRAFTACCLVDVLKICAPNAPFTPTQLKDIFMLFITFIIPALSDPSNAYNIQHKYVLVSLAEVKSIVLVTDLTNHDELLLHIFNNCFDIISGSARSSTGEFISKDVEYNMTQVLVTLVDESQSLPGEVVESIMAQFLRVALPGNRKERKDVDEKQSTLLLKELPEAYNMAKTICNSCPEKMARYVSQYFNDVILEVTGADVKTNGHRTSDGPVDSDDDEAPAGPTEAGMLELHKAHNLLRELWRASPAVLQNVIPQLEQELSAGSIPLRLLATETLGDIISGIGAAGPPPPPVMDAAAFPPVKLEDCPLGPVSDSILTTPSSPQSFAQSHTSVYNSFMSRHKDKSPIIRAGWTTAVGRILITSAGGIGLSRDEEAGLIRGLNEKLTDGDERVRLAATKVIGGFGFRDVMTRLVPNGLVTKPGSILSTFADRIRDKKHAIRAEAVTALGRIWGIATGEILAENTIVSESIGAIPTKVFDAYYANDMDLNVLLDNVMFEQLLPLSYPPTKSKKAASGDSQAYTNGNGPTDADKIRTERILLLVKSLNPRARKAFFAMQARQSQYSKVLEAFLKLCEENNGGVIEKGSSVKTKLDTYINWFAVKQPDPLRITQDLNKYVKLHDRRSYQLLRFAMAPENDFNTVFKAIKEFRKRLSAKDSPAGILDTFNPIIYRSASLIYNISHQPMLFHFSRTDDSGLASTANNVMGEISDKHPEIFQASVKELCKAIVDNVPTDTKANDAGSVDTLKALASFAKNGNNKIPSDRKFIQALKDFALYGVPAKVAKYAVSILSTTERKEMHLKDLLDQSIEDWSYGSKHSLTRLATVAQLTLLYPKSTEDASDEILEITTAKILLKTQTPKTADDPEWQAEGEIDGECEAKCWALKTLVNRLRVTTDADSARKLFVPVYKVLNTLIVKQGELSKLDDTPRHHKARLRLVAAQEMLKICTIKMYDDLLSPVEFNKLCFVAQDHLGHVRSGFVEKLQKYIVKDRLSHRFLTIIFLTAFEPSSSFRNSIMTWIRSRVKLCSEVKDRIFESVFPRLLHLLAHHPDYTENPEELTDTAKYILYYLTTVSSEANLPIIYKYAERVKQARDALPGADSDRLYLLSDLAQILIRKWQEKKGWNLETWPAKVGMPVGLFASLPSHEVAQEIAEKNYLPDEMEEMLEGLVRKSESKKNKCKSGEDDSHPSKKQKVDRTPRASKMHKEKTARPVKEKKTPKPRKSRAAGSDDETPMPSKAAVDRRRSGRGLSSSGLKLYADRDSDEDDEEMLNGVASWEYIDGKRIEKNRILVHSNEEEEEEEKPKSKAKGRPAKRKSPSVENEPEVEKEYSPLSDIEAEEVAEEGNSGERSDSPLSPEPEDVGPEKAGEIESEGPELELNLETVEGEDEAMPDADEEPEEAAKTPSPPPKATRTSNRRTSALTSSAAKVTKAEPAPKAKAKVPIIVAKPAAKAKAIKAKEPVAKSKGKGKGKAAAKDVFDIESD